MKNHFLLSLLLLSSVRLAAAPLGVFSDAAPWKLEKAAERGQTIIVQPPPGTSAPGLKINWNGEKFLYFELHLQQTLKLPADFTRGTISLHTWVPAGSPAQRINLRLIDAKGEIFQFLYYQPVTVDQSGPRTFDFAVDLTKTHKASWGGNNDHKFDRPVSLRGFSIDAKPGSKAGEIYLLGATVSAKRPSPADGVRLEVETGNPIHVLRPGEEDKLRLTLHHDGSTAFRGSAEVELKDYFGRAITAKVPAVDLAPGSSVELPAKVKLPARGHWSVRVRLAPDGGEPVVISRSLAYMQPAGPTPGRAEGFLWGISSHPQLHSPEKQRLEALAAALCGAKVVREDVYWHRVQPARGQWNFQSFDRTVGIFAEQGLEIAAILCYCAPWAAKDQQAARRDKSEPEPEAWRDFCREMSKRYRGKVRYWEVWNEPDVIPFSAIPSSAYAGMMRNAYRAIKDGNPEATVLTGGFATLSDHPLLAEPGYQEKALRDGRDAFDIHAYHEHGAFEHFVQMVENRFLPMRKRLGIAKPWWANETALTSSGGNERAQAEALYKKLIYAWSRGAVGYNWYDLRNDGDDPNHSEFNYGLLSSDFYPKPVYPVYNMLATHFKGREFIRQIEAGPGKWIFLFRDSGGLTVAAWSESKSGNTKVLRTDAKSAERIDLMGNRRPLELKDGAVEFELAGTPQTIRLPGATKVEIKE